LVVDAAFILDTGYGSI